MKDLYQKKRQEGFTIIEVMIVLAIAGLIMVIVFVAIPQLQKNQRNTSRKDVFNRIKTEIDSYASNNNGTLPTANNAAQTGFLGGFATRYLGCTVIPLTTVPATAGACTNNIADPRTGNPVLLGTGNAAPTQITTAGVNNGSSTVNYASGFICNGEQATNAGAGPRNYVLLGWLEGGAIYCLDNR